MGRFFGCLKGDFLGFAEMRKLAGKLAAKFAIYIDVKRRTIHWIAQKI
jgi:DNA-binding XRE family transcriptional regulator